MSKNNKPVEYTDKDYEFMQSLSSAILEHTPTRVSAIIKIWLITIVVFIIWASLAKIDEITRGDGDVVPYGQNQIIQNLEGGIVESIFVHEGQTIKKGDKILKINNAESLSKSETNKMKYEELLAKKYRLEAEANQEEFKSELTDNPELNRQIALAKNLYESNKIEFEAKDNVIVQQIEQKKQEYKEAKAKLKSLNVSLEYVSQEIAMTAPMVREGVKSKVDFLKLKREANGIENDIEAAKLSLPRIESTIKEFRQKRIENKQLFINTAKKELNEVTAEILRLQTQQVAYSDEVKRTVVTSPVDGIVQKLYVNTIGGVIKPGADLVEIVPTNEKLYLEVKIKPSDIAFLHPGAKAKVKVSAYDFAIHGGLVGKIVNISPDTITDKEENTFYLINIETEKNYLGTKEHPLKIIPGMTVSVDIVTGKKTIMQYILKPILKSKQYVFSER
ncbi:HlyD family type I secretion periplasmic adaptor subunit [Sulfurimonas lithotrophica]|uniref:HlyD family type I secretion periplasmic adaptor subunit n=1 Tax=Sulfurimonas lithotrophica TaxID=2590022 RepID=A0A5P8NZU8_9BACT|nr:HlyD family type I secretion periplasmic adaptor subunit [Sulfurimonas lithotrophica]QFR48954.1 HlyD family type I secretion periplasmic adaptor subunit [Sulfurimonas lithotrophica]